MTEGDFNAILFSCDMNVERENTTRSTNERKAIAAVLAVGGGAQKGDIQMFYLDDGEKEETDGSSKWGYRGG
jgi:hypothetical protein